MNEAQVLGIVKKELQKAQGHGPIRIDWPLVTLDESKLQNSKSTNATGAGLLITCVYNGGPTNVFFPGAQIRS